MTARTSPAVAFAVAGIGIASYSCMDAVMKGLSITSGAWAAVLWRSVAGVVLTGSVFVARRQPWPNRQALALHIARALTAGISVVLFFWGLVRVPLAQGVALTFLAPLLALYLAAATLGERIRRATIAGSVAAAVGVLVIAAGEVQRHASNAVVFGTLAIVFASILYAGSMILLRRQAQIADPLEVTFFTSLVLSAALMLGAPWVGWPAWPQTPAIFVATLLGTLSSLLLAWAYGRAEAQVLAPVEYTAFVWSATLGWLVFGERVSLYTTCGAALIVAGCVWGLRGSAASTVSLGPQSEAGA